MAAEHAQFEVYPSGNEYRWRLRARNGEIVAIGEGYASRGGAKDGIEAVRRAAADAIVEDVPE